MTPTLAEFEAALGPHEEWAHKCHEVSLKAVRSGLVGPSRVARGTCVHVRGQHSWVVLGDDCYNLDAALIDLTLWSYAPSFDVVWTGTYRAGLHTPHGQGNIFTAYRPPSPTDTPIELTPTVPFSGEAQAFLRLVGPLDYTGWHVLIHSPVGGWPSAEIIAAAADTDELKALVPIDILGMLTDRNPSDVYR